MASMSSLGSSLNFILPQQCAICKGKAASFVRPGVATLFTPQGSSASLRKRSPARAEAVQNEGPKASAAAADEIEEEVDATAFLSEVANLVKLVDSRDIVELELKNKGVEILIRKKLAPPPVSDPAYQTFPGPHVMAHSAFPAFAPGSAPLAAPAPAPVAAAAAPPPPPPPAAAPSVPALQSPMAGTFYRSPAPGEPAFVKVGDRVTKGQVVCIIEAMKLMNEIECDRTGVISDILVEDGKPVSIETPLFAIKP